MKKITAAACLLLIFSCNTPVSKEAVSIKNGEVSIAYNLSGQSDTAIVFVHGWSIDKGYWKNQQEEFSKRYKVVSPDLGGHGESGHNRKEWTIEEYTKDLVALINGLKLNKVILVGHSMAGDIILQTALTVPEKIIGFVGIDNLKDFNDSFSVQGQQEIDQFMQAIKANFDTVATQYCKAALFPPNHGDTASVNRVIRSVQHMDSVVAIASLESLIPFSLQESKLLARLKLPVHLIVSDYTPTNEEKLKQYTRAGYSISTVKGVGHYPMIEKPQEFNQLLQQVLDKVALGK